MMKRIQTVLGILLLLAVALVGYRLALSHIEIDIYRDRLEGLTSDYESLRATYNEAVARTAVTELVVKEGRLSVAIRTVEGVERIIETPFDPSREVYCDYVVSDGRLWIRRVYDASTPAQSGLVIDDRLRTVDWESGNTPYGVAIYRTLSVGRWVVTVTGDGSLGLKKVPDDARVVLSGPPPVRDYERMEEEITTHLADISPVDVVKRLVAPSR